MSVNPQIIDHESLAVEALELMRKHKISQLVTTKNDKYVGILHIQSLIKEGIAS
jgi:arabinose-5-phosphate isomerase